MTDYAAAPLQPVANLVLTPLTVGFFAGVGVQSVVRTPGGAAAGDFTITLDPGMPGGPELDPNLARTTITQRGTLGILDGGTTITESAVTYPTPRTIRVVFAIAGVGFDPIAAEVLIWRGN